MSILDTPPTTDTGLADLFAAALPPDQHHVLAAALEIVRAHALADLDPATRPEGESAPDQMPEDCPPEDRATPQMATAETHEHDPIEQAPGSDDGAPADSAPGEPGPDEAEPEATEPEEAGPADGPDEDGEEPPTPASTTATPVSPGSSGSPAGSGPAPARPGELQDKVATFLADHAGGEYTVTEVAKDLGHSGGAVGNAMKTLAADGRITETSTSPRKYAARTPDPYRPTPTTRPPLPPRTTTPCAPAARTPTSSPPAPTAPAAPVPAPRTDPKAPIRRRNGQHYYPRQLGKHTDVEVLHKLRDCGISALLEGPPGTGKTSLAEAAFPDLVLIAGDGDTQVADLVGSYTIADDGSYVWNYGPLVVAMLEGRPLFIDDATLISPKVLAVMYPAMDGRREIVVKEHQGETVTAAEGFYVIAGHNPHVHGAVLTDALASRFTAPIQVSTDYELAETLGVHKKAVQIARNLASQQRTGASGWAPQMRELLAFKAIAAVLGEDAAFGNMIGQAPPDDRDTVTTVITTILGRKVTPLALGPQAR